MFFNCNMNTEIKKNWMLGVHFHYKGTNRNRKVAEKEVSPIDCGFELHYKCDDLFTAADGM